MKTEITIEQSQNLINHNIGSYKASAMRRDIVSRWTLPVFALLDIFKLIPTNISFADTEAYLNIKYVGGKWRVQYLDKDDEIIVEREDCELIDALYSLLLWCIEKQCIN